MPTEYITEIDLQLAGRGHGVIDDHHRRCAESVTRVEEATLDQPNSERFKEVIANHLVVIDVLDEPACVTQVSPALQTTSVYPVVRISTAGFATAVWSDANGVWTADSPSASHSPGFSRLMIL